MYLNSAHLPVPPYLPLTPSSPQKKILKANQAKANQNKQANKLKQEQEQNKTKTLLISLSFPLPVTSSFVLVAMGGMCHTVDPLVQSALLVNVHYNESLIWFKASGFWYIIITGSSLSTSEISHGLPKSWRS